MGHGVGCDYGDGVSSIGLITGGGGVEILAGREATYYMNSKECLGSKDNVESSPSK